MGVEVRVGTKVVGVDADGVDIELPDGTRDRIESVVKVWAAGVQASPLGEQLAAQSGAQLDRAGRVRVGPDLTLPGHPEVFVVGDMMALNGLPGVAQVAIQGGRYAASVIRDRLAAQPSATEATSTAYPAVAREFVYRDKGSMATVSRFSAVASIGRAQFTGFIAWLMWLFIHLLYITGFKSRATTLIHWFASFIGRGRAQRATTERLTVGRLAVEQLGDEFHPSLGGASGDEAEPEPA
jgi:NADH dehydrogenase